MASGPGSWPYGAREAQQTFVTIAREIAKSETLWMLAFGEHVAEAQSAFAGCENIEVLEIETDDAWARDVGPTCVVNEAGEVRGIDWQFNAWGGAYDGLYAHWEKDNLAAEKICDALSLACYDAQDFVLEGGSVHATERERSGDGSLPARPGRNPKLTKEQIETKLLAYLGAEKVIWLPRIIGMRQTSMWIMYAPLSVRRGGSGLDG